MRREKPSGTTRACRVVTTSLTARIILANQLQSIDEISWCVLSGDAYPDPPPQVGTEVIPLRRELAVSDASAAVRIWRFFRHEKFDFVQTHTQKASMVALPAARLSGTTALYTVHGALYFRDNTRVANVLGWLFEKWCCAWAHRVLVQSREDLSVLERARICKGKKLRYVGNGVAIDHFLSQVDVRPSSDPPVVLMVSRLVREKGCADFISLARSLAGRASFVHVGPREDDQRDALSEDELAAAAEFVSFTGPVSDVRPYLAAADLVVQPSYREGIPRVVMEAAAAGKPVVAYDIRGTREVVDPRSQLLVPRGDKASLEKRVAELLEDPERRRSLGAACQAHVKEAFSEHEVVNRLRDVYREVLQAVDPTPNPRGASACSA
jgi:glycosyltransferase involved in cell wall biosynthesis